MLGRHVYRVIPAAEGGWKVQKDGETAPRARKDDRDAAVRLACDLAREDEPSRVLIEPGDGTIAEEHKFGVDSGQNV
jgi:Uncharacterized protein conserved in bacteria (DUF2188)